MSVVAVADNPGKFADSSRCMVPWQVCCWWQWQDDSDKYVVGSSGSVTEANVLLVEWQDDSDKYADLSRDWVTTCIGGSSFRVEVPSVLVGAVDGWQWQVC